MNTRTTNHSHGSPLIGGYHTALAAIRGHRFIEGENSAPPAGNSENPSSNNGGDSGNGENAGGQNPPTPAPAPSAPSPATVAQQQQRQQASDREETFSRSYVHELREEAKTNRIAHQEAQTARETAEQQLAEARAELTNMRRETTVRAAADGIANASLLLDSTSFNQSIAQVDPADTEAIKNAITTFVEKNSAYGVTTPSSSGPTPRGSSGTAPTTLEGAIHNHYSG